MKKIEQVNTDLQFGRREVVVRGDDTEYYVRIPTAKEQYQARLEKTRELNRLLLDDSFLTKKQLVDVYKKRGVNVDDSHAEMAKVKKELNTEFLHLAKIMNDKKKQNKINELSQKINNLREKVKDLVSSETSLFENSIESLAQLREHYAFIAQCVEKKVGEKYVKVYDSTDAFMGDKETSRGLAFTSTFLQMFYGYGVDEYPFASGQREKVGKKNT